MDQRSPDTTDVRATSDFQFKEAVKACRQIKNHHPETTAWEPILVVLAVPLIIFLLGAAVGSIMFGHFINTLMLGFVLVVVVVLIVNHNCLYSTWVASREEKMDVSRVNHILATDGYRLEWDQMQTLIRWKGFVKFVETDEFFLSFATPIRGYYLPKRVLSPEQVKDFRRIVRHHSKNSLKHFSDEL